jgi:uncharacterized protein YpiB (UPF0302 family)
METVEETFKPGEWVQIIDHRMRGCTGYILKYDALDDEYRMMITRDSKGKILQGKFYIKADQLVPIKESKDEDDLLALIDLALDLNEKEWFMELTEQLSLRDF